VDLNANPIHLPIPSARFPSQDFQGWNPASAQTLPGEQADLNFRLVQPAPMLRRVKNREAFPESGAQFLPEKVGEGLPAMDVQIVHHEMDRSCPGIAV
jgi:hypothetical protein